MLKELNFNINIFQHFNIFRLKLKNQHFLTFFPITTTFFNIFSYNNNIFGANICKKIKFNINIFQHLFYFF